MPFPRVLRDLASVFLRVVRGVNAECIYTTDGVGVTSPVMARPRQPLLGRFGQEGWP